jgi:nucleotide-binding universal stress UspA family protein
MRKCPCPVWVVKPGQATPYSRILAALDLGADSALNTKIMDLATSLASRDGAVLHSVHAWDVEGNDNVTLHSETTQAQREQITERHRQKHETDLAQFLSRYPLSDIETHAHLYQEAPAKAIGQVVDQEKIDLIAMGTLARTGVPGMFIGDTAEMVLASVKCGMLTVKLDSFETPITLPGTESLVINQHETKTTTTRRIA